MQKNYCNVPFLEELSENMEVSASMAGIGITKQIESAFQEFIQNMGRYVSDFSMKAVKVISVRVTEIPGFIVKIIVTVISTFYIAIDYDRIIGFLKKCIPAGKEGCLGDCFGIEKNGIISALIFLKQF